MNQLVIVACHAIFKNDISLAPDDDANWYLRDFQKGEAGIFIEHLRNAWRVLQESKGILVFSGSKTVYDANLSEAESYLRLLERLGLKVNPLPRLEERALDSFQNLLFPLLDYYSENGFLPEQTTLVSWAFKKKRFEFHANTIGLKNFRFLGVGMPEIPEPALSSENYTLELFKYDPWGCQPPLFEKKAKRNVYSLKSAYYSIKSKDELPWVVSGLS